MKTRRKICCIYVPTVGLVEAGNTKEETLKQIKRAERKKLLKEKRTKERLQEENPGKFITKVGNCWLISENPID